jgi:aspartate kinase
MQAIFAHLAAHNVTVDMIVQDVGHDQHTDISFTVPDSDLQSTLEAVHEAVAILGPVKVTSESGVAKVSVVGLGMAHQSGVANRMFQALARERINIQMITTSEIKISALIAGADSTRALRALHQAFELHHTPADAAAYPDGSFPARPKRNVDEIIRRLGSIDLEELFLDGIDLDTSQGRITLIGIPDVPGVAAAIFDEVARDNIFVDMIVQSYSGLGNASLSFTVPSTDVQKSLLAVKRASDHYAFQGVEHQKQVAKLSVSGIGLRSHTGVAVRMFQALGEAGVNLDLINTSEVRVNTLVAVERGREGLAVLERAFADVLR